MSDNPFAERDDKDSTIIRPIRGVSVPRPSAAQPAAPAPTPVPDEQAMKAGAEKVPAQGASPVLAAAAPLLLLLARLRNLLSVPEPSSLRDNAIQELRRFEAELRRRNLPMDQIRTAHYALCASLDDVVQSTPWGSRGPWADASLTSTFHREVKSGERFFDLLKQLSQNAGKFLPVVELMYVCMALGMQGRYRLSPRGPAELDRVREETYLVIMRQRPPLERALSLHWQGVSAPYRPLRAVLPVWVTALFGLCLIALLYVLFAFSLNDASDRLFEAGLSLPPGQMPVIARTAPPQPVPASPPPAPGELDKLAGFLAPEVKEGLVVIAGTDAVPIVRLLNKGMFASGSAVVERRFVPIIGRIGEALKTEPGQVDVVGYTDNQPIHTVQFPSNFQLSQARAKAAAAILSASIEPSRITTAGRADADPIASNATPEGQQQNRRIEIVLHRAGTN
ncbi:MAG TPA: type VI secretion system protein TssL, long form [Aliidongia sp.]|nr:type VI secretion system protein TssL, long form [Aliidongia sp.]